MSAKHTPGPWEVEKARNGLPYRIIAPNSDNQKPGAVGTRITRWGAISLPSSEEGEANARLIAAAPDLLEAVIYQLDLNQWIESADVESPFFEEALSLRLNTANDYMTAAIAKATGKDAQP